jgi:hypothetical protein
VGRRLMLLAVVAGAMLWVAAPAMAKGEYPEGPISGSASISGPGLKAPILFGWHGECGLLDPCMDVRDLDNDFLAVAMDTGISGRLPRYAIGYYERPALSELGPRYTIHWVVDMGSTHVTLEQDLYPYAPDRPWVHTPKTLADVPLGSEWWPAPPSMVGLLHGYGLPASPPGASGKALAATSVTAPSGLGHLWTWIATAGAMLALMVAGAVFGRPTREARATSPA